MKSFRFICALCFASVLAVSVARAGDDKEKAKDKPAAEKVCSGMGCCKPDKDGKVACATEGKSCCCDTGEKTKDAKKDEKVEAKK